jgi:hypothetical protein
MSSTQYDNPGIGKRLRDLLFGAVIGLIFIALAFCAVKENFRDMATNLLAILTGFITLIILGSASRAPSRRN